MICACVEMLVRMEDNELRTKGTAAVEIELAERKQKYILYVSSARGWICSNPFFFLPCYVCMLAERQKARDGTGRGRLRTHNCK